MLTKERYEYILGQIEDAQDNEGIDYDDLLEFLEFVNELNAAFRKLGGIEEYLSRVKPPSQ